VSLPNAYEIGKWIALAVIINRILKAIGKKQKRFEIKCTARWPLNTEESMATPCSVNA